MRKYRNQLLIGLGFGFGVIIAVIAFANARDLARQLGDFPLWMFAPMLILKLLNWAFRYAEWHYFLGVIGVRLSARQATHPATPTQPPVLNWRESLLIWTAGLPIAISPGKIAEILKAFILKNMTAVPVTRSIPVIFAERLVDGIAVVILVGVSGLGVSDQVLNDEVSAGYVQIVLLIAVVFMAVLIGVVQFRSLAHRLLALWRYVPVVGRFHLPLAEFYESSYEILQVRHLVPTIGMGLVGYTADGIIFYLILLGVGHPHSWQALGMAIFILGFSVIVAALSAMPGGAGGRELTIGVLLAATTALDTSAIGLAVLLVGFAQIWFGTLLGLVVILIFRRVLFPPPLQAELATHQP
jgi:uncharacterized membrane protein YbhN (UPF0104 family)